MLIAGASGLIGREIVRRAAGAHEVRRLVRRAPRADDEVRWDPDAGTIPHDAVEHADAIVSLSGASLSRLPWTARYRDEILRSRVRATATIAEAIARADAPPRAWVSASAVGIYGDRPGEVLDERSARGTGFLADVVEAWEGATAPAAERTRVVHSRTGIVLARDGALAPLMRTTALGLGAAIGDGSMHWPWIGLGDEARAILHLATASELSGPVDLVGPTPATSREVTTQLAAAMHRPHLLRLPRFALRAVMGLAAQELLLADQDVRPERLRADGFAFETPTLPDAMRAALRTP